METVEKYLDDLYRVRPDLVYSVSREFVRNCQTPMLVLPNDTAAHAYQVAIDVASLAPNAKHFSVSLEGPTRAESTDDQPGAQLLEGTSPCNSGASRKRQPHAAGSQPAAPPGRNEFAQIKNTILP